VTGGAVGAKGAERLLRMRGIRKRYGVTEALRGADLEADPGEVHAIVGENGAGKSTLMKVLAGALSHEGEIFLAGRPVEIATPLEAHRLGIRAVYQELSLVRNLSVAENLLLGRMPGSHRWIVRWPEVRAEARRILDDLGFAVGDVRRPVGRLPLAQQQMVEIAKAVMDRPAVLILDEPSATLPREQLEPLFAVVRRLTSEGGLVLYVSHRLDEVVKIADRITVLKDGVRVDTVTPGEADERRLITMMVGRTVEETYPRRGGALGAVVLRVDRLGREGAFRAVTFSLSRGEIVGLFGLVGSGRTAVARAIFGAEPPTQGEMRLGEALYRPSSPRAALSGGVVYLTEDRARDGLILPATVRDNVSLAAMDRFRRLGLILAIDDQRRAVQEQVRGLRISPTDQDLPVSFLSGGNQQKVLLARGLLTRANVLILDEPTRGVDVATKVEIYRIVADLAAQGVAVILISSELPEVLGMSDRILVMREGALVGEVAAHEASEERVLAMAAGVAA
jgi:ribose transport system ATP-binding protein